MRIAAAVVSVLFLSLLTQTAVSQVPDDRLIVPGRRIGKWTLDMTIDDLLKLNGPRRGIARDVGLSRWTGLTSPTYEHLWIPLACFYALTHGHDSQKVIALGLGYRVHGTGQPVVCQAAEAYRTTKGPLYTPEALEAAYGKAAVATLTAPGPRERLGERILIIDKIGLAAWVPVETNLIGGFLVFRPGTARSIWKY